MNVYRSREVLQESSDSDDFEYGSDSLNYTNNRETSFTAAARMQSKNHPSVQLMPPAPQKTRYYEENVQKDFQAYLKNPVENKYKVQVFKTCTDAVRKNCAKLILDFVISNPQNINEYANITRDIVTSGSLSSSVHKTLLMHMIDFLTEMQQWHFSKGTKKNWDEFTNIGKFLGQIQKRDLLKPALLCKWLDGVFDMIAADTNAVKSYVSVLSIVMIKLEADDKVTYKKHKQNLSSLCSKGKIPHQYMQWTSSIFTKSQGNLSKASSMSSVVSETSSTSKKSELPIQPTATTQICTNFQKFLNNLEAGRNEKIDLNVLRSCSEAAVRGCALILLEHAAMYPKNAKLYAAATQNTIVSQISQRLQFTENLAHYFDVELTKWYKLDAPEKSNWSRIKNVAVFLGELYNFKVFDIKVLSNWVEKICLKEDFNANGAAMILFNIIRDKLMHRSAEIYERFVIFPKISESDTKFVASFRKLMKEAGKIKMDEKKPTKAQILQQIYSPPLVQYSPSIYPPPMPQLQTNPRAHLAPFLMKSATPMRAPFMQVPIAPNQSVYTFIQPAPAPPRNAFDELQRLVNVKLNFGNHALIIHEIMSLKIPETEENFRKITNTLVSRAKQRPDLIPCVCEILVKFPQKLKNDSDFRNQTRLSLNQQFDFLCSRSKVDLTEVQQIVILVKEAHLRSAIGINVLSRVVENVATKALNDVKVSLKVLLIMLKVRNGFY